MKIEPAIILGALLIAGGAAGCKSRQVADKAVQVAVTPRPIGGESRFIPKAIVYRTDGNFYDNVPIMLNENGTEVVSFPAPTDLSQQSMPLHLSDGWMLDRRGVGPNTVFTSYTYKEYMALPQAPSPTELLAHVIPGSGITSLVELPLTMTQASSDPKLCDEYIASGFRDCKILLPAK